MHVQMGVGCPLAYRRLSYHDDYLTSNVYTISVTRRTVHLLVPICTSPTSTGVLEQKHEDNYWHPVAYHSSLMSKEERNYPIYDREMLGLIHALED